MQKNSLKIGFASLVIASSLLVGAFIVPQFQTGGSSPLTASAETIADKSTIEVNGIGKIAVKPDIAYINFGVMTEAKEAKQAQASNAEIFAKLKKAVLDFGVKEEDIKTVQFNVSPKYNWTESKGQELQGYTVQHMIEVKTNKLDDIGTLLDNASKAGTNQVNGIRFSTEKLETYELQAITKAMENARTKADTIAKASGKSVKSVLKVTHNSNGGGYTPSFYGESAKIAMDSATQISQGELTIETFVNVVYEF